LPDGPSVPHHPEDVSFPKRCFVVLQELAYIMVNIPYVGVALWVWL
jgi:hypothetical protein